MDPGNRSVPVFLALLFSMTVVSHAAQLHPRDFAVELTARVSVEPPEITLMWRGDQYARNYTINRKARADSAWVPIGSAAGHDTWFIDKNAVPGAGYEYQVVKEGTLQYMGYGYIYTAIQLPLVETRGRVILLVESSVAQPLAAELDRLRFDLTGDGWRVVRRDVLRTAPVSEVRELIRSLRTEDPANTRSLFLFGNIPVPYSGDLTPDEHDNHRGAWPADVYYADLDGKWTDESVVSTNAEIGWNRNIVGDGKFDQNEPPTPVELQVGRVDLSRMTCFINKSPSRDEIDLLRQYLEKDHQFRHGMLPTEPRALIYDRIGLSVPEPLSTMAWRNFAPFAGGNIDVIRWGEYMPFVSRTNYLWTSVVAGGGLSHADGVGTSDAFALNNVHAVFAMFSGSYYGDWDNESNFLRAALGAGGRLLVSIYSGQPQWICHTMALGETIGAAAQITQDNDEKGIYIPHNRGAGQVHVALHGDPTLRAHPIRPPRDVRGVEASGGLSLAWEPSAEPTLQGYLVYEASTADGPFRRLTPEPVQSTEFLVTGGALQKHYMVKAVALTTSPSGTYWNSSQGAFFPSPNFASSDQAPSAPRNLAVSAVSSDAIDLTWLSTSVNHTAFEVERRGPGDADFIKIASLSVETLVYRDASLPVTGSYGYRVRAINSAGASSYSNPVYPSTQGATVEFVGLDRTTQGAWRGVYGGNGFEIPDIEQRLPPNSSLTTSNAFNYKARFMNDDLRMLQIVDSTNRSANCWVHRFPFAFNLSFNDERIHQVAIYSVDYNRVGVAYDIEIYDAVTGKALDQRRIENVSDGLYAVYNIRRQVVVKIVPPADHQTNAEIYGLFFDLPKTHPVRIEPSGGAFAGKTLVRLATLTSGAGIRYTLDGSEPSENSLRYDGPFWLYGDARVRAVAFKDGLPPSEGSEAQFKNTMETRVSFLRWDERSLGGWTSRYGKEGFTIPRGGRDLPPCAEVVVRSESTWLWSDSTTDDRAPFVDRTAQRRVAAGWYAAEALVLDLGVFDTRRRAVALYFLDWDDRGRVQEVELLDAAGVVRDRFTVDYFANGKYLIISLKGYARVRIRRIDGENALLNGIFFDPVPIEVNVGTPVPLSHPRVVAGAFKFSVSGTEDSRFCLDESRDMKIWTCFTTNMVVAPVFDMQIPLLNDEPLFFYRGHVVP